LSAGKKRVSREAAGPLASPEYRELYWPSVKITVIVVFTSTGCPFSRYGLYSQCETADIAEATSEG